MKKYLLGLLMIVVMLAVVAACGNGGTPADNVDDEPDWTPPPIVEPTPEPGGQEPDAPVVTVAVPTPGRLLVHADGTPWSRAEILAAAAETPAPSGELVIGDGTRIAGNFIGGFSSEATGQWVLELLHGTWSSAATMVMDFDGRWIPNPLVQREPVQVRDNPDGTRTYTFNIYTDNLWSDGTPITAIDYVFGIMANSSPQFREVGGTTNTGLWIEGFFEFLNGDTEDGEELDGGAVNYFRGIRLYSDSSFSVTVRAAGLPYVWEEITYQNWAPTPFHYWNSGGEMTLTDAPGGVVLDGFTVDLLNERVVNSGGIRDNPTVTAGAYMIREFDAATGNLVLDRRPGFQGTFDGFIPQVQTIAIINSPFDVIMDQLRLGEIDMVHAQRAGDRIQEGWNIVNDLGLHRGADFPRHGYGYLAWHGDHGPSQFANVRRSIAWMIDRDEFAIAFTGGWGTVQHGPYALRGWEFQQRGDALYDHPDFTHYGFNPANALAELEAGGWVLNSAGEPFVPGEDQWRYKDVTGMYTWMGESVQDDAMVTLVGDRYLMRLEMIWAANDNRVSDLMRVALPPVAASVGMNIIEELYPAGTTNIPAWQRSGSPYREGEDRFRAHHIYTLAVGLVTPTRLWNQWSLNPEEMAPGFNTTWHGDWELHDLAWATRPIDGSQEGWEDIYLDLWLQFQLRYNYVMPLLPLYADDDHDFVPLWLANWDAHGIWDFRHAVQRAYIDR